MSDQTATATNTAPAAEGAAPAVADVTPATPTHVQEKQQASSYAERMARAMGVFKQPVKAELEGVAKPAEAAPEPAAPEPEAKPAPEPEKVDAKAESAHARALAALRKAEAENLRLKSEGKSAAEKLAAELAADRAEAAKLKAQIEAITKNPIAALKAAGMTAEQFMRQVAKGEIAPPAPDDELREQIQAKLSPLEQELAELKAEREERKAAEARAAEEARVSEARAKDLTVVRQIVTAEEYPITAALDAFDTVLTACYQSGSQDVAAKAAEFEAHQVSLLESLLTPKVLSALEKRSAKIRETVSSLRGSGQSRQTTVSSGGPRVAARDVVSAPTTPIEPPKSDAERMARAKARLAGAAS